MTRIRIGFGPVSSTTVIAISNIGRDESLADDLNVERGIVSSRVALLLRSTEIQPGVSKIRAPERTPSSPH